MTSFNCIRKVIFLIAVAAFLLAVSAPEIANAQLTREMRELFGEIKNELDGDLKVKFEAAINNNTDKIFFSASEFQRFRDHPVNPFDGLHEIEGEAFRDGIELKFELPNLRNRMIGRHERQSPRMLNGLAAVTAVQASSIVEVRIKNETVALGTVVDSAGHVLTKASELGDAKEVTLRTSNKQLVIAKVERIDSRNDVALLTATASRLTPVVWADRQPLAGDFVVSADINGKALAVGTYSNSPRSLENGEQAVLGVQPQNAEKGIAVVDVTAGSAADLAGLKVGDVVLSLDEKSIVDVADLVNEIRKRRPGTTVQLDVLRAGQQQKLRAVLAGRNLSPERAARFKMMNRLGAIPSNRSGDFPWVFQHDTPLFPEQCGGPVLDLDGNVIGLNIARQGRIASFAIPSSQVQTILADLLREDIAKKE